MDLDLTEEQDMLREAVADLCVDASDTVRACENDSKGFDDGFWNQLAAMGLTGLMIPEEHGGSAMSLLDATIVYEELGRSLVPSPHFVSSVVSAVVFPSPLSLSHFRQHPPKQPPPHLLLEYTTHQLL